MIVETTGSVNAWALAGVLLAIYTPLSALMWYMARRDSRKAKTKRRLLVREDGQLVWRTVRGSLLVGGIHHGKGVVDWGSTDWDTRTTWAVIQTIKKKFVVYRFDERSGDEPQTGLIQVIDAWGELEVAVPPRIFEQARDAAGLRKSDEYKEVPIKL
jgi:hypothetical protein